MSISDVEFRLPDLGEGLTEAEIVAWHVGPGDRVVADQPLVSVETDKAVVEIPAPRSGRIAALHGAIGDVVEVGTLLVEFDNGDAARAKGGIVGELPTAAPPAREDSAHAHAGEAARQRVSASPAARRRARERGLDIEQITPADGSVVQVSDVDRSAGAGSRLSGLRRRMAERMADAHRRVVPATVTGEADISDWPAEARTLSRLVRGVTHAAVAVPQLNAWFDDDLLTLTARPSVDLGIAVETDDGLLVPVLRQAEQYAMDDLNPVLEALIRDARARRTPAGDLRGQTITLSNFGAYGGLYASLVVMPPQVAIVGSGRSFPRPGLEGSGTVRILPLSITFDHRALTGIEACRFLEALIADLENSD